MDKHIPHAIDLDYPAVQRAACATFRSLIRGDPRELRRVYLELAVAAAKSWTGGASLREIISEKSSSA